DYPMHVEDLQLMPGSDIKLGLGLWNHRYLSLLAELLIFSSGLIFYGIKNRSWKFWLVMFVCYVVLLMTPFLPIPASNIECAISGLFSYALFAGFAFLI